MVLHPPVELALIFGNLPVTLKLRKLNLPVGCSKRVTARRPVKVSFRKWKVALFNVPEANGFGTAKAQISEGDLLQEI
jgi:hypothetical protein